jgi:hypothetical protein
MRYNDGMSTISDLVKSVDNMIGPIRFECNRHAISSAATCAAIRGVSDLRIKKLARAIGRHTLTQRRIELLSRKIK